MAGDFFQALTALGQGLQGQRANALNTPSALQELAAYQTMSPEQQKIYWNIKRQQQVVNLGGSQAVLDPSGGGSVAQSLPVTLRPEDQPVNAEAKATATAKGGEVGKAEAVEEKKFIQAPEIDALLTEAEKLLPDATGGGFSRDIRDAKAYFGVGSKESGVDKQLNVLGAKLTASVPRFEGPQSDKDTEQYRQAAGDLANAALPISDRLAAAQIMRGLNNKYLGQGATQTNAQPVTPAAPAAPTVRYNAKGQKATLVNGQWVIE